MIVRFWGTRGSLPAPLGAAAVRDKIRHALRRAQGMSFASDEAIDRFMDEALSFPERGTFGGNSPCVEIDIGGDRRFLCDLGTGAREFGMRLLTRHGPQARHHINVFMSHLHWDHIMGFPITPQAYIPGNRFRIHGCHEALERAFRRQHNAPSFPVKFGKLPSAIEFVHLEPDRIYDVDGLSVRALQQQHEGDSFAYRFEHKGKAVVYSTDSEHKEMAIDRDYPFVEFFSGADLVIFDAMYSLADCVSLKEDWGHSSNIVGVELCHMAGARRLCLFHHEPAATDEMLHRVHQETVRFEQISEEGRGLEVISAYDGLEIQL